MLRAEPVLFGPVASDPTVSRLIDALAKAGPKALTVICTARSEVREHVWKLAADTAPDTEGQVVVDLDGVLVFAHSDQQDAAATWNKSFGHHPLMGFVDHGRSGPGEPVAGLLTAGQRRVQHRRRSHRSRETRPGPAAQKVPAWAADADRTDFGGGTHAFVEWLAKQGRWLSYSLGMTITEQLHQDVLTVPPSAWTPAIEPGSEIRDGAWVAELDEDCLTGWPKGMRLVVRKERPHLGAQLRFTEADGLRLTCCRSARSPNCGGGLVVVVFQYSVATRRLPGRGGG